jgi:hypothetical protein
MASITTARTSEYSDIDFMFSANPNIENDIAIKRESAAIRQSVLNILRTNHGEKPFRPYFGANLTAYLFENIDQITAQSMSASIRNAITNDEPRVNILNIEIRANPDTNAINITVTVQLISTLESIDIQTNLERLR